MSLYLTIAAILPDLPFSPSDLPWWGWLLGAVVLYIIAGVAYFVSMLGDVAVAEESGEAENRLGSALGVGCGIVAGVAFYVLFLASTLCAVIGIVRLVKWAWYT